MDDTSPLPSAIQENKLNHPGYAASILPIWFVVGGVESVSAVNHDAFLQNQINVWNQTYWKI